MNILYLLFSFTTGGTERLVTDICNEMVTRDHTVHLYVVNDLYDASMLSGVDPRVNIYLQKRSAGGGDKLHTLLQIARYIRENKIDVVHCNSFDAPELLLLKPVAFPRTRILHTIHGMGQYTHLSKLKCILRNLLCDRFIAISQSVCDDIVSHGAAKNKVSIIYNAIDLKRFSPNTEARNPNQCRIGNVARIMPELKGQDILLQAIALLHEKYPNIQCFFAGGADAAHQQAFQKLRDSAVESGIADQVVFLGNVEDVPSLLRTLDIFVLPSRSEGFGISLVEAMAMGVPCVASDLEGPAEVLQQGKYGMLFPVGDAQALCCKLEEMICNYDRCQEVAQQALAYAREQYHIKGMCDRLESLMN